jgi:hypothetical protein
MPKKETSAGLTAGARTEQTIVYRSVVVVR